LTDTNNVLPNSAMAFNYVPNGSYPFGVEPKDNKGYLVVGTGEFDVGLFAITYESPNQNPFSINIEHAAICNAGNPYGHTTGVDHPDNGNNPTTYFMALPATFSSIAQNSIVTTGRDCSNLDRTISIGSGLLTPLTNGKYGGVLIAALKTTGGGSQQNSFRLIAPGGVTLGYSQEVIDKIKPSLVSIPSNEKTLMDASFPEWRNISDSYATSINITNTALPSNGLSDFSLNFNLDYCTPTVPAGKISVRFYDADDAAGGGALQSTNGWPNLNFILESRPKSNPGAWPTNLLTQRLIAGNGGYDYATLPELNNNYYYSARVSGLSRPNALQFSINTNGIRLSNAGGGDPGCDTPQPDPDPPGDCSLLPTFFVPSFWKRNTGITKNLPPTQGTDGGYDATDYRFYNLKPGDDTIANVSVTSSTGSLATRNNNSNLEANYKPLPETYPYDSHDVSGTANFTYQENYKRLTSVTANWSRTVITKAAYWNTQYTWSNTSPGAGWTQTGNSRAGGTSGPYAPTVVSDKTDGVANIAFPKLGECMYRKFDLIPMATAATFDDPEDPTSVTANLNVSVSLKLPSNPKNLLVGMKVNSIGLGVVYTVVRLNGTSSVLSSSNTTQTFGTSGIGIPVADYNNTQSVPTSLSVSVPPLGLGDKVCVTLTTNPSAGSMDAGGTVKLITTGSRTSSTVCSDRIVNKPYLRAYGGDVLAGSGFGDNCTQQNSGIIAFARNRVGGWVGAGNQLGVFANSEVKSFSSMFIAQPTSPNARVFANTDAAGGYFGSKFCADDFWLSRKSDLALGASPASINGLSSGQHQYAADKKIQSGSPVDKQLSIFVDGDIYITGTGIRTSTGPWANIASIPFVSVIARGNIYIEPSVTQIDGLYVAMPKVPATTFGDYRDGGYIYTCTDNGGVPTLSAITNSCSSNTLLVNGSLVAKNVKFLRTKGSLRNATVAEPSNSTNIAESITYTPEMFLAKPLSEPRNDKGKYDSVISLPPSL
ncbi:hypothetical protein EBS40_08915, partial [bacterium]|nr:hypothetical protein [bacterium]